MPSAIDTTATGAPEPVASPAPARAFGRRAAVLGAAALGIGLARAGVAHAEPVRRDPFLLGVA
ncbi:MAG: hypothetical protein HOV68_16745, partial [Streptomycetaceae bacterium]|nr:hypothetical protein [Streptomycetaceae bacterium]